MHSLEREFTVQCSNAKDVPDDITCSDAISVFQLIGMDHDIVLFLRHSIVTARQQNVIPCGSKTKQTSGHQQDIDQGGGRHTELTTESMFWFRFWGF